MRPDRPLSVRDSQAADDERKPVASVSAGPEADRDTAPEGGQDSAPGKRKKSWRQLMMIVVAAIVLMLLIKAFVVQVYR